LAALHRVRRFLTTLWTAERGIAAVEYALLLAMISGGILMGAEYLSNAVSDQFIEVAAWFGDIGCSNSGGGNGTGGAGGSGQGGGNVKVVPR